jgi:hypothetical protein
VARTISIVEELKSLDDESDKARRLKAQTAALQRMNDAVVAKQAALLEEAEQKATERTRHVLDHMAVRHAEFNDMVANKFLEGNFTAQAYVRYLIQAWYHTRYTPEFEAKFGKRLREFVGEDTSRFDAGNKFIRIIEEGADEELGHELWALADIRSVVDLDEIDLLGDVFPETRALVRTQFDRLERLNFKGFLGYSFYLEFYIAKYAGGQIDIILESLGLGPENVTFMRNHHLVDQGHAADNIELLNFVLDSDEDVDAVIDNMDVIHLLYSGAIRRCFEEPDKP